MCLVAILKKEELHNPGKLGSRDFLINYPHLLSSKCCTTLWPPMRLQKMKDSIS